MMPVSSLTNHDAIQSRAMSQSSLSASTSSSRRPILITGLGPVCALGIGIDALWSGLLEGRSGLGPISLFDATGFASKLGGQVPDLSARSCVPKHYRKAVKVMARDTQIAVVAAHHAVKDANLVTLEAGQEATPTYRSERIGCQIGAGLIAAETKELAMAVANATDEQGNFSDRLWGTVADNGGQSGMENLAPLWMLKYLPNMLACHLTILHGCQGPSNTITCGEASGLLSLGESCRVLERNAADVCFSGGAESKLNLMGMLRLELAGLLTPTTEEQLAKANDDPTFASSLVRPFDPHGNGTLLAEGGCVVILEEAARARARNTQAYAAVVGFGSAHDTRLGDVFHLDTPASRASCGFPIDNHADDDSVSPAAINIGLRDAILAALADADLDPAAIDAIVPSACGRPESDLAEAGALKAVFGNRLPEIPLILTHPNLGQCMAGHSSLQVAVAAMCLKEQTLPARLQAGSPVAGLQAGPMQAAGASLKHILITSSTLGGQNAAMILATPPRQG